MSTVIDLNNINPNAIVAVQVPLLIEQLPASWRGKVVTRSATSSTMLSLKARDGILQIGLKDLCSYLHIGENCAHRHVAKLGKCIAKKAKRELPFEKKLESIQPYLSRQGVSLPIPSDRVLRISQRESQVPFTLYRTCKGLYADFKQPLGSGHERRVYKLVLVRPVKGVQGPVPESLAVAKVQLKGGQIARVFREKEALEHLRGHPEIIQLHGYEQHHSRKSQMEVSALIYDFCNLGDLNDIMTNSKKPLAPDVRQKVIASTLLDILRALCILENEGIHHRDIKPENIFLHRTEEGVIQARLADFGFVTTFAEERADPHSIGTPFYLAPDYLQGYKLLGQDRARALSLIASPKCDIWSFGIAFYQLRHNMTFPEVIDRLNKVYDEQMAKGVGHEKALSNFQDALAAMDQQAISTDSKGSEQERFSGRDFANEPDSLAKINFDMLQVDPAKRLSTKALLARARKLL